MTIKLVALDLDDTLLDSKLAVSPRASVAIRQAVAQGVTVTIATGRMYRSALPYARQLKLDVPLITYNGALIKSSLSAETFLHQPVERDLAGQLLALCRQHGWYVQTYMHDELYVKEMDEYATYYSRFSGAPATAIGDRLYEAEESPTKILVMAAENEIPGIQGTLKSIFGNRLSIVVSKPTFIEITHPLANKGKALAFLADKLGIKQDETMAIGDSGNDVDMLNFAGWGVAMGNASQAVKAIARLETLSNEADGVAEAIEKYVLK